MVASVSAQSVHAAQRHDQDNVDLLTPSSNPYDELGCIQSQHPSPTLHDAEPRYTSFHSKSTPSSSPSTLIQKELPSTIETSKRPKYARKSQLREYLRSQNAWPWWWETWACIGSLASFLATAGLLAAFQGKSQPEWPYGITLNSAVSWLSTIIKGFLLVPSTTCISQSMWISYSKGSQSLDRLRIYDSASRGPWGSLELLWTLRARYVLPPIM
jgi:hypothetical protein